MARRWAGGNGLRADLSGGGDLEPGAAGDSFEIDGGAIVLAPRPLGATPGNTPDSTPDDSSTDGSGGASGGSPAGPSGGGPVLITHVLTAPVLTAPVLTMPVLTMPTGGFVPVSLKCRRAVQGKIAWNYSGNKSWGTANLERLCRGAATSEEPARCFNRAMHGGINWGGGTRWQLKNALDLCEGSTNATATISCFQGELQNTGSWKKATETCGK